MKLFLKSILTLSAAALLFASCAKEKFADRQAVDGELTDVNFSAQMENVTTTKAVADDDGAGAYVNRCIMEIYYGDDLFTRMYAPVSNKKASFTTQLVSNRTYKVAFWADYVETPTTEAGLSTDKYYETSNGLGAISLKETYVGNIDARDAFALCKEYTIAQGGSSFNAILRRPFAQINVITTDVATVKKVASLVPDGVDVTLKNVAVKYNVLDSTAVSGQVSDLNYTASVYNWDTAKEECTLSMDYIFAEKEKAVVDIDWKATKSGNTDVSHSFTNIPYQRNYRTNIKGALLTTTGQWNVTVDPIWESSKPGEQEIVYDVVADIAGANTVIANELAAGKKEISVKFTSQPNDAGTPGSTSGGITCNSILTTSLPEDGILNVLIEAQTKDLFIGDYVSQTSTDIQTSGTYAAVVNVNVPANSGIQKFVINAPSKTVFLNGIKVASAGIITDLDAIVSNNTLVIEKGQAIGTLTIRQGGLEIHGTVGTAVVEVAQGKNVYVRDCENLSQDVYDVLAPYIADGYVSVKGKTTPNIWDIVPATAYEAAIGKVGYETLAAAMAAVQENDIVTLLKNIEMTSNLALNVNANYSLNLNGKTISSTVDAFNILAGKLTLIGNGTVDTQGTDSKYSFLVANNGKFVIGAENQNYDIVINDLVNSMTETTIWGGTISKVCCYARSGGPKSDVTINGGKIKYLDNVGFWSKECPTTIYLNGGIYGGFEPISDTQKDYCKYVVKSGYKIGDNTDEATKADYPWALVENGVAKIGSTYYETLAAAFAAVTSGQTITMIADATIDQTIVFKTGTPCTLDLNGKTITSTVSGSYAFHVKGTFTVADNSTNHDGKITTSTTKELFHLELSSPNLTINNGIFEVKSGSQQKIINCEGTSAQTTINDGHFIAAGTQAEVLDYLQNTSNTCEIKGGTFDITGTQAVAINIGGASGSTRNVKISGGTFNQTGSQAYIIVGLKMSKLTITGGTFTSNNSPMFQGVATYDISGGSFIGNGNGCNLFNNSSSKNATHSTISGGDFQATGGANIFAFGSDEYHMDISGGTFIAASANHVFWMFSKTTSSYPNIITVTGGTFSDNPANAYRRGGMDSGYPISLVAEGYKSTSNGGTPETWTVSKE